MFAHKVIVKAYIVIATGDPSKLLCHDPLTLWIVVGARKAAHTACVLVLGDAAEFGGWVVCALHQSCLHGVLEVQNLILLLDLLSRCTYCYMGKTSSVRRQTDVFCVANAKWTLSVDALRGFLSLQSLLLLLHLL